MRSCLEDKNEWLGSTRKRFRTHALPSNIGNCIMRREVRVISDVQHRPIVQIRVLTTGRSSVSPEELRIVRNPTNGASAVKNFRPFGWPNVMRKRAYSLPSRSMTRILVAYKEEVPAPVSTLTEIFSMPRSGSEIHSFQPKTGRGFLALFFLGFGGVVDIPYIVS